MTISPGKHFSSSKSKLRLTVAQLNGGGGGSQWCRLSEHRNNLFQPVLLIKNSQGLEFAFLCPLLKTLFQHMQQETLTPTPRNWLKQKGYTEPALVTARVAGLAPEGQNQGGNRLESSERTEPQLRKCLHKIKL